jgi:hypothetical protein
MAAVNPLATSNFAIEEEMIPLPREEVTPPVTKIYLVLDMVSVRIKKEGANLTVFPV